MSHVDADITTTAHSVHLVPHYPNKDPIIFSGNDAEISGILHELKLFLIRVDKWREPCFFLFFAKRIEKTKSEASVQPKKSETTMAKKSYMYQNKSPMSAKEKQLRDAEAAAVRKFMRKAPNEGGRGADEVVEVRPDQGCEKNLRALWMRPTST